MRRLIAAIVVLSASLTHAEQPVCQTYQSPWSGMCATSLEEAMKMQSTDEWLALPEQQEIREQVVRESGGALN